MLLLCCVVVWGWCSGQKPARLIGRAGGKILKIGTDAVTARMGAKNVRLGGPVRRWPAEDLCLGGLAMGTLHMTTRVPLLTATPTTHRQPSSWLCYHRIRRLVQGRSRHVGCKLGCICVCRVSKLLLFQPRHGGGCESGGHLGVAA